MADRTATRMPGRGQTGFGRTGRRPGSRLTAEADAKSVAARHSRAPYDVGAEAGGPGRNVAAAVGTGLGLAGLFVICYVIGPAALVGLATVAIAGCSLEAFAMFQRAGFRPATLVGALAQRWCGGGCLLARHGGLARGFRGGPVRQPGLVPGPGRRGPAGSERRRDRVRLRLGGGAGLVRGAVACWPTRGAIFSSARLCPTVVADLAAWFVGSRFGSHPLAPAISPSKTWEGFAAGGDRCSGGRRSDRQPGFALGRRTPRPRARAW